MKKTIKMFGWIIAAVLLVGAMTQFVDAVPYQRPFVRTQALYLNNVLVTSTAAEMNAVADVSYRTHTLTASGTVNSYARLIELDKDAGAITAALAAAPAGELIHVVDTSDSGTAAHTLTLSAGTFNGTNTIATFNAPAEAITVWFDSESDGTIINNAGSVALSGP